ncbi:VWFA and cache domain-containing protein 1 [Lates japonicus]|uniref:VWFA and cache domain-containing protein 1 n=1 Tax=Lates japonicus TaxID=270547 RepID=A0AAD3M9M9_LATJO|nr:VWFA and cache domain-containing protein 1 [Lates japonicus]
MVTAVDEEVASLNMIKSAPVGPVAGALSGMHHGTVLAVYAYRHQIHRRHTSTCHHWQHSQQYHRFIAADRETLMTLLNGDRCTGDWDRECDHGYSTMSPQEDSENPPGNNDPLSAGVDVGNHDDDLDLDTPPQTAA